MISFYLTIGVIAFVRVFARSSQQLNVCYFKWLRVPFYSAGMSYPDAFLWLAAGYVGADAAVNGGPVDALLGAFYYGTALWIGSWFGTWAGMYVFRRVENDSIEEVDGRTESGSEAGEHAAFREGSRQGNEKESRWFRGTVAVGVCGDLCAAGESCRMPLKPAKPIC